MLWFIQVTNPSESDRRGRESIHVIGKMFADNNINAGMNFHYNDDNELMFRSDYIVIVAKKQ